MPNIPLAEIARGPNSGAGYVPQSVDAIRAPNIMRAASMLRQDPLPVSAFTNNSEGLAKLGEAGKRIAGIFEHYQQSMRQAADERNMATADRLVTEARAAHSVDASTMPEDKWLEHWNTKYLPKLDDAISKMKMSSVGSAKLGAWYESQISNANSRITIDANKQFINSTKDEQFAYAERARADGRNEDAYGSVARLQTMGIINAGEAQTIFNAWDKEDKLKAKEDLWNGGISTIQRYFSDPTNNLNDLPAEIDAAVSEGTWEIPAMPEFNGDKATILKLQQVAHAEQRNALLDRKRDALEMISQGGFADADEIQEAYANSLPQSEIDALKQAHGMTPEEQHKAILTLQPHLMRAVEQYDASLDPQGLDETAIRSAAKSLPAAAQSVVLDALRKAKEQPRQIQSKAIEEVCNTAKAMFEKGDYGAYKLDAYGVPRDMDKWQEANNHYTREMDALKTWAKQNPQDAADSSKVYQRWNTIRSEFYIRDKDYANPPQKLTPTSSDVTALLSSRTAANTPAPEGLAAPQGGSDRISSVMDFVRPLEGWRPQAHPDGAQTSVGYGTRAKHAGETLTRAQGETRLREELTGHAARVDKIAQQNAVQLNDKMFNALVSFDFNTGEVARVLSQKTPEAMARKMAEFEWGTDEKTQKKVKMKGLQNRRAAEINLFNEGLAEMRRGE